jgi:hypothetical protein
MNWSALICATAAASLVFVASFITILWGLS